MAAFDLDGSHADRNSDDDDGGSCGGGLHAAGELVEKIFSGRHGKLEGTLSGGQKLAHLTLHTKFEAAENASAGYVTLQIGTWVECPGVPWNDVQLVRLISCSVRVTARSKSQNKYFALMVKATPWINEWFYAPLQQVNVLDGPVCGNGVPYTDKWGSRIRMFEEDRLNAEYQLKSWQPQSVSKMAKMAGIKEDQQPDKTEKVKWVCPNFEGANQKAW